MGVIGYEELSVENLFWAFQQTIYTNCDQRGAHWPSTAWQSPFPPSCHLFCLRIKNNDNSSHESRMHCNVFFFIFCFCHSRFLEPHFGKLEFQTPIGQTRFHGILLPPIPNSQYAGFFVVLLIDSSVTLMNMIL